MNKIEKKMLATPMKLDLSLNPYRNYSPKETPTIYPPNISPLKEYSPASLFQYFDKSLLTILEMMKTMSEIKRGTNTSAIVKL